MNLKWDSYHFFENQIAAVPPNPPNCEIAAVPPNCEELNRKGGDTSGSGGSLRFERGKEFSVLRSSSEAGFETYILIWSLFFT